MKFLLFIVSHVLSSLFHSLFWDIAVVVFLGTSYGSNLLLYYDVRYYGCDITVSILRYTPAFPLVALKVILGLLRFLFLYLPRGKDEVAFVAK